jgi:hypothetical protein
MSPILGLILGPTTGLLGSVVDEGADLLWKGRILRSFQALLFSAAAARTSFTKLSF